MIYFSYYLWLSHLLSITSVHSIIEAANDVIYNNQYYHKHNRLKEGYIDDLAYNHSLLASIILRIYDNTDTTVKHTKNSKKYAPLPSDLFEQAHIRLNIGGIEPMPGWYNVNAQVDSLFGDINSDRDKIIIRNMNDLYGIPDGTVTSIYSSHTLEHASSLSGESFQTLLEWRRVLKPRGLLMVSVPDMENWSRLFLQTEYPKEWHWAFVHMMTGGHRDVFDYHYSGYDEILLTDLLTRAGFCELMRVQSYNVFPHVYDASTIDFLEIPISLNMVGRPCETWMKMEREADVEERESKATHVDSFFGLASANTTVIEARINVDRDALEFISRMTPYVAITDRDIPRFNRKLQKFYFLNETL